MSYAFVPNWTGPTKVTVIDTTTLAVVPSNISTLSSAQAAAASPDGRVVYLLTDRLHVIDMVTMTETGSFMLGLSPMAAAFTPDGRRAYIVNGGSAASISVVDVTTDSVIGSPIDLPDFSNPRYIEITPDGLMAYVTSDLGVFPVNLATSTAGSVMSTGPLNGIAILPDGHTAFVAERNADQVRVIDLGTGIVDPTPIPVGDMPFSVVLSPDATVIYVVNNASVGSVSVIDVATRAVVATVGAGIYPGAVSFTPDGRYAYVPNNDSNDVTVIDVTTHTPLAGSPFPVGSDPSGTGANFITPNIIAFAGGPLIDCERRGARSRRLPTLRPLRRRHAATVGRLDDDPSSVDAGRQWKARHRRVQRND